MSDGGKGGKRRPTDAPQEQVTLNWSSTFGPSKLERMLEAERLAQQELDDAVQEGLAKMAEPISIQEMPELQAIVKAGLKDGSLVPS